METIPDRVYFKDRECRFLSVNRAFLDMAGIADDTALQGKTDLDIFKPEHAEPALADDKSVIRTGVPIRDKIEKEVLPDGRIYWVSTTKIPLRDSTGAITGLCGISRDVTASHLQEESLRETAAALHQKQQQMDAELELAQQIQHALLPHRYPSFPSGASVKKSSLGFAHRYLPMGRVGGDFFAVIPVSPTQAGVLICDVMGHGIHAALITAVQRSLIEDLHHASSEPGLFLTELNRRLRVILARMKTTLFVTAFYVVVDVATGTIHFASAAHPAALRISQDGAARFLGLGASRKGPAPLPLGLINESTYETEEETLEEGDRLLLYTDGLRELEEVEVSDPQFLSLVEASARQPDKVFLDALIQGVRKLSQNTPFVDDVCLVEIHLRHLAVPEAVGV